MPTGSRNESSFAASARSTSFPRGESRPIETVSIPLLAACLGVTRRRCSLRVQFLFLFCQYIEKKKGNYFTRYKYIPRFYLLSTFTAIVFEIKEGRRGNSTDRLNLVRIALFFFFCPSTFAVRTRRTETSHVPGGPTIRLSRNVRTRIACNCRSLVLRLSS